MKYLIFLISCSLSLSCSTTQCKDKNSEQKKEASVAVVAPSALPGASAGEKLMTKVKIFKADGTLQCNQGKKIAIDIMAKELAGIKIYSSENLHDGLMRILMCRKQTGQNNVFEIESSDLQKALSLGFKKWIRAE